MKRSAPRVSAFILWLLVSLATECLSEAVLAAEAEVNADFNAQLYDAISPWGEPVVRFRRYTNTLGLDVSNIDGVEGFFAPELVFRSRLRLDADLGQGGAERNPEQLDRYIPGLEQAPLVLMYAFLVGRHYLDGVLGFRLGRQYQMDTLGFWSFDGALLRLDAPGALGLELYGGFEQRDGQYLLTTSRYEADGVLRGNRGDLEENEWPFYLEQSKLAPAYGVALQTLGLAFLQARVSYRKVINRDRVLVSPFADAQGNFRTFRDTRTSTERAAASIHLQDVELGGMNGDLVYDIYLRRVSDVSGSLDWYTSEATVLGIGYDYSVPSFDADSIFNWFVSEPSQTAEFRASSFVTPRFDVAGRAGVRFSELESTGHVVDQIASLTTRYRWAHTALMVDGRADWGDTGHRIGGDITTRREYLGGHYDSVVVLSVYDWSDALRPEREATGVSYVLGGGVSPNVSGVAKARLGMEWEHAMNRLFGHQFRFLVSLNVSVFP